MRINQCYRLLCCFIIMLLVKDGLSQRNGEIRAGIGHGSAYYFARQFQDGGDFFNWDDEQLSIIKKEIIGYLEYSFSLQKRYGLGIALSHSSFTFLNYYDYNGDQIKTKYYQTTLTISNKYYYFKNSAKDYQLYGSLSLGFSLKTIHSSEYLPSQMTYLRSESETTRITSHLNFIGISMGKKFGGYAELGYGFKGIINAGFFYKL